MFITSTTFALLINANIYPQQESVFSSEDLDDTSEREFEAYQKDRQERLSKLTAMLIEYNQKVKDCPDLEMRKRGAFLLTGVIVYQSLRIIGHAGIWLGLGAAIVTGFTVGGLAGAGTAYLYGLSAIPGATAVVESTSLTIGTAASWIPGLP